MIRWRTEWWNWGEHIRACLHCAIAANFDHCFFFSIQTHNLKIICTNSIVSRYSDIIDSSDYLYAKYNRITIFKWCTIGHTTKIKRAQDSSQVHMPNVSEQMIRVFWSRVAGVRLTPDIPGLRQFYKKYTQNILVTLKNTDWSKRQLA